jgi:hypothetical protein
MRSFRKGCEFDRCRRLGTSKVRFTFLQDWESGMDRNAEVQRLGEADRHICDAERAIGHQILEIEQLCEHGHSTAMAVQILETFQRTLKEMQDRRNIIIRTIEKIDMGSI